jgi:hypothetical protein
MEENSVLIEQSIGRKYRSETRGVEKIGDYEGIPVFSDSINVKEGDILTMRGRIGEEDPEVYRECVFNQNTGKVERADGKPIVTDKRPMGIRAFVVNTEDMKAAYDIIHAQRGIRSMKKFGVI